MRSLPCLLAMLIVGCGGASSGESESEGDPTERTDSGVETAIEAPDTETIATDSETPSTDTATAVDAAPPPTEPPIPGPRVKAMSFNIRVGTAADGPNEWSLRKGLVFNVFKNQDADVVGLQEDLRFQLNAIDDAVPGYRRIGVGARDGAADGEHCAILFRQSAYALKDSGTFWLSAKPSVAGSMTYGNDHPRIVTWVRLAVRDTGYEFYVYNTHFDHISQNSREKSALQLMATIAKRTPKAPFLVMGDLNVQEDNVVTRYFKGAAKIDGEDNPIPLFDTFRVLHPDEKNARTAHGFGGAIAGDKIDYIYFQTKNVIGAHIDRYNVDGRYPSDHYPIVTTVKFPAAP